MKKTYMHTILLVLAMMPLAIFSSTLSQEVTHGVPNTRNEVTIHQWNPLLNNQYVFLIKENSGYTVFSGNIHIAENDTGNIRSLPFSSSETSFMEINAILEPGNYDIYLESVDSISYSLVLRGMLFYSFNGKGDYNTFQIIAIVISAIPLILSVVLILWKFYYKEEYQIPAVFA